MEIPPTSNEAEIPVVDSCYLEHGPITGEWYVADFLRLMRQLDVLD